MRYSRSFVALAAIALVLSACGGSSPSAAPASTAESMAPESMAPESMAPSQTAQWPDSIVIGFVPSTEANALVTSIQPLADYLTNSLGIEVKGFVSNDYTGLVTAMQTGQAQIGALPPYGLVQAVDKAGGEVILQSERFGSGTYHTQFMTNNPDKYCTISPPVENTRVDADGNDVSLRNCNGTDRANSDTPVGPIGLDALSALTEPGTTISFVEESSSSGYIFPATILVNAGFDLDTINSAALFAGSHNASVIAVCDGSAEIGVSFDDARPSTTTDCNMHDNAVVFAYGGEIPNDGIAVSGDLPDTLKLAIKGALEAYAGTDDGAKVLNDIYQITAFTDPNLDALQLVRDAVDKLGYSG